MLLASQASRRWARAWLALSLSLGGCDCGYHTHASDDAAADAPADVPPDAPRDAPVDTAPDAPPDAADPDARILGCDPGWQPLPSIPDELEVLYAENPGCLLNVEWESCGPGCERLVDDPRFERSVDPNSSWLDGDRAFFTIVEWMQVSHSYQGHSIVVVASTDGVVHSAWLEGVAFSDGRDATLIQGFGGGAGATGSALIVGLTTTDGNYRTYHGLFYQAPLEAMSTPLTPSLRLDADVLPGGTALQFIHASATTLSAEVQPQGRLLLVQDGLAHWLGGRDSATPGTVQESVLVGREAYWLDWGRKIRMAHGNFEMESEVFLDVLDADILGLSSDGENLAWVQAYEPNSLRDHYARMELWSAPVVNSPSDLRPHRISASYSGINQGYLGDGSYFTDSGSGADEFAQVYSITDGSVRSWKAPDEWHVNTLALWAQAGEVAYGAILSRGAPGTIIRLRVDEVFHDGASP